MIKFMCLILNCTQGFLKRKKTRDRYSSKALKGWATKNCFLVAMNFGLYSFLRTRILTILSMRNQKGHTEILKVQIHFEIE